MAGDQLRRGAGEACFGSIDARKGVDLTAGAQLTERWGRGGRSEGANQKGKRISRKDATDARTGWAGRDGFGLQGQCGQWAGWARGRVGRKVGRAEIRKKEISELKIGFLNLARLWKFVEGDLGGILTWGFFLNSSRLLKDFRKI
jgi:hypothetical protein